VHVLVVCARRVLSSNISARKSAGRLLVRGNHTVILLIQPIQFRGDRRAGEGVMACLDMNPVWFPIEGLEPLRAVVRRHLSGENEAVAASVQG
jgi:hypothetical protein